MPDESKDSFFLELERVAASPTTVDSKRSVDELRNLFDRLKEMPVVSGDAKFSDHRRIKK